MRIEYDEIVDRMANLMTSHPFIRHNPLYFQGNVLPEVSLGEKLMFGGFNPLAAPVRGYRMDEQIPGQEAVPIEELIERMLEEPEAE